MVVVSSGVAVVGDWVNVACNVVIVFTVNVAVFSEGGDIFSATDTIETDCVVTTALALTISEKSTYIMLQCKYSTNNYFLLPI
jgi:hypothetical protein